MHMSSKVDEVQTRLEEATLDNGAEAATNQDVQVTAATDRQDADPDLVAKIVKQVNFYFSDTNLPTDNFLLREVRQTPEGWVSMRLIAGFKKMKSLTKDIKVIVSALETSSELVVSGHRVRRKLPLPFVDQAEVLMRTVIVENLPQQATIDSLTEKFSVAGQVKMVRICQPNSGPRSIAQTIPGADIAVSRQQHALIEFGSQMDADTAVKKLTDTDNWRSGLRVRPLLRQAFQQQQHQAKSHASRQQAQQQQAAATRMQGNGRQQDAKSSQSSVSQGQEAGLQGGEPESAETPQAQPSLTQQAYSEAQAPQANSYDSCVGGEAPSNGTVIHVEQGAGSQHKGSKASSRAQKHKKTKKDYAAWAGATAETRAVATAHLEGNPDVADDVQSMHAGVKGPASAPGSCQPKMPDGSRGFSMGRGRAINSLASAS